MCYSALVKKDLKMLGQEFGAIPVREDFDQYCVLSAADPKTFPAFGEERIYPNYFAPIVRTAGQLEAISVGLVIAPMRYSAYPPVYIALPKNYPTFNARRDNLDSKFWSEMYGKNHGIIVLGGFFEWVAVRDLLSAGVVTIGEVQKEFDRQREERKVRVEQEGKLYRPTTTELQDPRFRKIVIQFYPRGNDQILVPVVYSMQEGQPFAGFAIITDEPPLEVKRAGHDRCPINLTKAAAEQWLTSGNHATIQRVLDDRQWFSFSHSLAKIA